MGSVRKKSVFGEACGKKLGCGHPCFGVKEERECCPCLVPDCKAVASSSSSSSSIVDATSSCAICFTEDLGSAPSLLLSSCPHLFHFHCLLSRLRSGFPSSSIDFRFLSCPLCGRRMRQEKLEEEMRRWEEMERKTTELALARLGYEQLEDSPALLSPSSAFYQQPAAFALHHFLFYQCFSCRAPYFAGAKACGVAEEEELDRKELLCVRCSPGQLHFLSTAWRQLSHLQMSLLLQLQHLLLLCLHSFLHPLSRRRHRSRRPLDHALHLRRSECETDR